jgi:nucleotide-binding universal stress UspA family protein
MFRHVLIPTDGSSFSDIAVTNGIKLAKGMKAKVTGLHVTVPFRILAIDSEELTETRREYESHSKARAKRILAAFETAAKGEGVTCESAVIESEYPYEAIIDTARDKGCDLILMASHGRHGVQALLLGSETHKVLIHSKIPVLVYR